MRVIHFLGLTASVLAIATAPRPANAQSTTPDGDSYYVSAQADLRALLDPPVRTGRARNVILFVGDGRGISTQTAARIYQGQRAARDGESTRTAVDTLPFSALVRTFAHDAQVSDSAPTATAMTAGVRTRNDIVGLDQTALVGDCAGSAGKSVVTLFEQAEARGLATGVVSTARITHATPAATYAHTPNRDWENDSEISQAGRREGCTDIARQLVEWPAGDGFEVVLGGGRAQFLPSTERDPELPGQPGLRTDGRNLISEWQQRHPEGTYVWNTAQFEAAADASRLLGLFEPDHMRFDMERAEDPGGEPSLAEMTARAIGMLERREQGYVLMIEAGRIDHAHHIGLAGVALDETVALDRAVEEALRLVDLDETLIIVTADHSHNMTIAGYPRRDNPILGVVVGVNGRVSRGSDGKAYTTLSYANGPGAVEGHRHDPREIDTAAPTYVQPALVHLDSASHGGEDVALHAVGPWAHLFRGTIDQPVIYHVMAHALGFTEPQP